MHSRYAKRMIMANTASLKRRAALASAINRVLPPKQRAAARELCSAEAGHRCSTTDLISWMRVNMPSFADRVDDLLFPQPLKD